jgi:hypothetical protein
MGKLGGLLSAFLLFGHTDFVEVAKSFLGKAAGTLHNIAYQIGLEHLRAMIIKRLSNFICNFGRQFINKK